MKRLLTVVSGIFIMSALTMGARSENIVLENGWNLKGTSCYIDVKKFNKDGISILWKYDGGWYAWSPNEAYMKVISELVSNGVIEGIISEIKPYEGFWVKITKPVDVDFCETVNSSNETSGGESEDFEELRAGLSNFLENANGRTVTIFEDEEVTCKFVYDGNSTLSVVDCSEPDYNGNITIDWNKLEFVFSDGRDKIVLADNNTLCINYEEDGIYRTSCAVINVLQLPSDDEIKASLTEGSRVLFSYNPQINDWQPVGICITHYDNGTVVYTNKYNEVVGECSYTVEDGTVVTTCNTDKGIVIKKGRMISPFNLPGEDVEGNIVNIKFYNENGTLMNWKNVISIKVENCESFWEEYKNEEEGEATE